MSGDRLRTACVVGDGVSGWSAACALARVAGLRVALVAATPPAEIVDRLVTATPATVDFHRDIGLDPRDLIARAGATARAGTRFRGWTASDFVHAYGPVGSAIDGMPFAALWPLYADAPFDAYSPAAALARAGRMPGDDAVFDGVAHGLRIDAGTYRAYLASYARHLGVLRAAAPLAHARVAGERVAAIVLADGAELTADLFIDATGGARRLIGMLPDDEWHDWRDMLPCDTLVWEQGSATGLLDEVDALANGWRMAGAVSVTCGGRLDGLLQQGRRARAAVGNVVAVGEAFAVIEPLEAAPLHLLHTGLDRLVASLPGRAFAQAELDYYNDEAGQEADRLRDFIAAHYLVGDRAEPFWPERRAAAPSRELAETMALFRARGRLPVRDGEGFARDSWRAILFGGGVRPARADALAAAIDPRHARDHMRRFRQQLTAAVVRAPAA